MLQTKFPRLHERQEKIYIEDHRRVKKLAHHDQRAAQRRTFTADWARSGVYLKKWTTSGGLPSTAPAPIKLKLYQRYVVSINSCIYGSECWGMPETYLSKLWSFHTTCLWRILWTFWHKKISNEDLAAR